MQGPWNWEQGKPAPGRWKLCLTILNSNPQADFNLTPKNLPQLRMFTKETHLYRVPGDPKTYAPQILNPLFLNHKLERFRMV